MHLTTICIRLAHYGGYWVDARVKNLLAKNLLAKNLLSKNLLAILLVVFSGYLYGEPVHRIPSSLNDGERGAYMPKAGYAILGVSIDSATFDIIKSALGEASIDSGQHTENSICYVSGGYRVDFTLSSLGFGYDVRTDDKPSPKCGTTNEPVVNGMGLEIGMSKADVMLVLGEPSQTQGNRVSYTYWVQERPSEETQDALSSVRNIPQSEPVWLDVYSTISVSFDSGVVSQFSVNTTETY